MRSKIGILTAACATVITIPTCRHLTWRPVRTTLFIGLGLAGLMPMIDAVKAFGLEQAHRRMGWGYFCLEGVFYISGALLYAAKVPERWGPGRFDIVGASHQLFHGFVLLGAAAHLAGILNAFEFHHDPDTRLCHGHFAGVSW